MSVTSATSRVQYTQASSGETFSVPFYFLEQADIAVIRTRAGADTTLVLNSDYGVTNAGTNPSTATVSLFAGQAADIVTIYRNDALTQGTDLTTGGPLPARTLTQSFDKLTMLMQQQQTQIDRAIRVPESNASVSELTLAARASKVVGFDSSGVVSLLPAANQTDAAAYAAAAAVSASAAEIAAERFTFSSIASLKAVDPVALGLSGATVTVLGYYTAGDAAGVRTYRYDYTSAATDNGGTVIAPTTGSGRWLLVFAGSLNVLWFGAKGDGVTDDLSAFQAAYTASIAGSRIWVPSGNFYLSSPVIKSGGKSVLWEGGDFRNSSGTGFNTSIPCVQSSVFGNYPSLQQLNGASATDFAVSRIHRDASYTGGTPGYVNSTLKTEINVSSGAAAYEWGNVTVLNNSANAGNNVAVYGQGNKQTPTTGPTWAGVFEAQDFSNTANPTTGLLGLEVDVRSNGTDTGKNRIGIDVVLDKYNGAGTDSTTSYGVRLQNNGHSGNTVTSGFSTKINAGTAFDCSEAAIVTNALWMPSASKVLFDTAGNQSLAFNAGTTLQYKTGSTVLFSQDNSGNFTSATSLNSQEILIAKTVGGAVGNTSVLAAFHPITSSNTSNLYLEGYRHTAGTDWNGLALRIRHNVDGSDFGFIDFNSTNGSQDVAIGTGSSTVADITSTGLAVTGKVSATGLIKFASLTVSGAGSASTAGAGSVFWATDLTAITSGSTATGGGSLKHLVASDGTNWIVQ